MVDVIYRQAAVDAADRTDYLGLAVEDVKKVTDEVVKELKKLPSIQPEIIRCKDCKFASGDSRICMKFGHSPIGELDFCAWAERKTDERSNRQAAIATAISGRVRTLPTTEDGENWIRVNEVRDSLLSLPSAQPKRGKWIYGEDEYGIDGYHCDKCGFFVPWDYAHQFINYIEDYNFCPSCGADMRGEQDETN